MRVVNLLGGHRGLGGNHATSQDGAPVFAAALLTVFGMSSARAAEYGTGPWVRGYTDIFGGVLPSQPGCYSRTDVYHYNGSADTTIFDGRIALDVDEDYTATLFALSYVTPWKILGGTYAVAVVPSLSPWTSTSASGFPPSPGRAAGRSAPSISTPATPRSPKATRPSLRSFSGGTRATFIGTSPASASPRPATTTRKDLANTSLNHWAIMSRFAATYFDPKTGWEVDGAAIYTVNWENPATDYETGNILNLEGAVTKNFGPLGIGVVSYAMIQTTGDSGSGARLGSFESRVYGVGPIVSFTTSADPSKALTVLVKWYSEFDAEHTFEGNTVDVAASFKF